MATVYADPTDPAAIKAACERVRDGVKCRMYAIGSDIDIVSAACEQFLKEPIQ